jgi:hypothetical protein
MSFSPGGNSFPRRLLNVLSHPCKVSIPKRLKSLAILPTRLDLESSRPSKLQSATITRERRHTSWGSRDLSQGIHGARAS